MIRKTLKNYTYKITFLFIAVIRTDRTRHLLDSSIYPQHKKYNIILFSIKKKLNLSNISSKKIILSRLYLSNQCGTQLIRAITRSRVEMTRIQVLQSLISFAVPYYRKENLVGTGERGRSGCVAAEQRTRAIEFPMVSL